MLSFPWALSFVIGFLSLSEEILWVRIIAFANKTLPPAFSFVLGCYLIGIALGAGIGKRLCARAGNLYAAAAIVLSLAALGDVSTPILVGRLVMSGAAPLVVPALAIILTAALKSILFPIVHHLGSPAEGPRVGRGVSRIYFGNILGATLGPLLTGFLALDFLSVDECFGIAAALCLLSSAVCVLKSARPWLMPITLAAAIASSAIAWQIMLPGPGSLAALAVGGRDPMTHFIANRHGIIHTARTTQGDYVFGNNVYDGVASVDVDRNQNRLDRLYMVALLQPQPGRVLFIGLSAGAWVRAMQGFPGIESIDVVEINPGYLELMQSYPRLEMLVHDARTHIHIDDGRRWLKRHPEEHFDVIVQNTSYYWRANMGNLLSREYLAEVARHLNKGGIALINTTGSYDALATAPAVFAHAYRYANFLYASDRALLPDVAGLWQVRRPDGKLFALDAEPAQSVAARLVQARLEPVTDFLARHQAHAEVITDDNLLSEYRHGKRFGPAFLRVLIPPEVAEFNDP